MYCRMFTCLNNPTRCAGRRNSTLLNMNCRAAFCNSGEVILIQTETAKSYYLEYQETDGVKKLIFRSDI